MAHVAGLVAAGEHSNPVPHAHVTTTTTHKTLRGPRGGLILWNDEKININKSVFPGIQGGPLEHVIASKAVSFAEALKPEFKKYQKQVRENAKVLAAELVAKGFKLVSGGTDNHLMLLDLSQSHVSGKQMEDALGKVHITVNKNTVPNETRSPFVTSGIRIGTPALTSRGMGETEMKKIAGWIWQTYENIENMDALAQVGKDVQTMAKSFPLYPEWRK
jgi:glycine hydroxymethyltransferase